MFKKNICLVAVMAMFVGCVQKNPELETYDLSNHWFNIKSLNDNKVLLNKNIVVQYTDGIKTSSYEDFNIYKKNITDKNQIEEYTFFEDINKSNYKTMMSNKSMDLKYNILENEIKETFLAENQTSSYKRNIKFNDKVIEERDIDGSTLNCTLSNYYDKLNIKDKINSFFNAKYLSVDKNYNNVMELQCKDSFVDGEYYIFMAKDVGTIFFMRKDKDDGSTESSYSILDSQTIIE